MNPEKRNVILKNKDKIAKYSTICINLFYCIALGVSAIVLQGQSFSKELAISFAPSLISIVAQFLLSIPSNDIEIAKKHFLTVASEIDNPDALEKVLDDINITISAQSSARKSSEPIAEAREIAGHTTVEMSTSPDDDYSPKPAATRSMTSASVPKLEYARPLPPQRPPKSPVPKQRDAVPMNAYYYPDDGTFDITPRHPPQ